MSVKSFVAGLATCLLFAQPIVANNAFEEREERMKTLGSEAKTMGSMIKGRSEFDAMVLASLPKVFMRSSRSSKALLATIG